MGVVQVLDGFEFKDDLVFYNDIGDIVANKVVFVIDLDLFLFFGTEARVL